MSLKFDNAFTRHAKIELPIICGAMYPCSNPELVAAVSEAGGIGIIQPLSLVYVHGHEFRAGLRHIKKLTQKPVGLNIIVEKSSKIYEDRMKQYFDIAVEEGIRFFVTSLGSPRWVVERAHAVGGVVYHDVVSRKWADKALSERVDGLILVNQAAGGHAGHLPAQQLLEDLKGTNVPLVCAGGIGDEQDFARAMAQGYLGVQLGTRFIATKECTAHIDYKQAIVNAHARDIVLTDRVTGVPLAVIENDYIRKVGTSVGFIGRKLLKNPRTKHYMRMLLTLESAIKLRSSSKKGAAYANYWQAGRSVEGVKAIESVNEVMGRFAAVLEQKATA